MPPTPRSRPRRPRSGTSGRPPATFRRFASGWGATNAIPLGARRTRRAPCGNNQRGSDRPDRFPVPGSNGCAYARIPPAWPSSRGLGRASREHPSIRARPGRDVLHSLGRPVRPKGSADMPPACVRPVHSEPKPNECPACQSRTRRPTSTMWTRPGRPFSVVRPDRFPVRMGAPTPGSCSRGPRSV